MKLKTIQYSIYILIAIVVLLTAVAYIVTLTNVQFPSSQAPVESKTPKDWKQYASSTYNFTALYPNNYSLKEDHAYTALGPGKDIPGIAFMVPESMTKGTNLSTDSYMSVEYSKTSDCLAGNFLGKPQAKEIITENGRTYTKSTNNDAGAGNRYEEIVYATKVNDSCYGFRLFIHSTVLENYEPGTISAFNRTILVNNFKKFRSSFVPK